MTFIQCPVCGTVDACRKEHAEEEVRKYRSQGAMAERLRLVAVFAGWKETGAWHGLSPDAIIRVISSGSNSVRPGR